jgi:hypothetical protein
MRFPLISRAFYGSCVLVWLFVVVTAFARPAYGYVDPGSGLFAIQIVGSTIAGMGFLVRRRIRQFFSRLISFNQKEGSTKRVES